MNSAQIEAFVTELAQPIVEANGCSIWDVRFVREGGEFVLKVTIDSPEGIDIEKCVAVNRALSDELDRTDPIEESYCLEVSSAGINRELKRDSDYDAFLGSKVDVKLKKADKDGNKRFTADLVERRGDEIVFSEGRILKKSEISSCRLHVDF